jgi:hypothetical protein
VRWLAAPREAHPFQVLATEEVRLIDEILKTRLAEVRRTLERSSLACLRELEVDPQSTSYTVAISLSSLEKEVADVVRNSWGFLESQFQQESRSLGNQVEDLQKRYEGLSHLDAEEQQAALVQLWQDYTRLAESAESLFGEIVELISGLALRDRSVDPWLFKIADRLVGWYAQRTSDSLDAVTVPSVRGAVARTLVRIVGLRFPEWSVWALPLIAYEFAYQYFRSGGYQGAKLKAQIEKDLPGVWEGNQVEGQAVLLADAFATFTTGPAYLLAAINLRLSPQETARALVIFRVLEGLDQRGIFGADFLEEFRAGWQRSPASGRGLAPAEAQKLKDFADAALKALGMSYLPPTKYSVEKDWSRVKEIHQHWAEDIMVPGIPLEIRNIQRLTPIDVLNAAWFCRLKGVADARPLEVAVRKYYDQILAPPPPGGASFNRQVGPPNMSGVRP